MDLTDQDLEPAARALYEHAAPGVGPYGERKDWGDEDWDPGVRQTWFHGARAVAEALPQPTLPICPNCEGEHFTCGACGIVLDATVTPQPVVDREALAQAVHHRFCLVRHEATHAPDKLDYDKADEILEVLALLTGSAK